MKREKGLPTDKQELLLKAALFKGKKGISAWEKWQSMESLDDIETGSLRLIPLLYRNLQEHGIRAPVMSRYKGIYQSYWARSQLLLHNVTPVLKALHQADIEIMLFKGAGLLLSLDLDIALRPMDDVDIIVRPNDFRKVPRLMQKFSWFPKMGDQHVINETTNEISFQNKNGQFLDVHLHPLLYARWGDHEMEIWEKAQAQSFRRIPVKTMDNTNHLIHIIVHGLGDNAVAPIRWVADATMLLQHAPAPIQWDYLVKRSSTLHTTRPVYVGLRYLKERFSVNVPENVLLALEKEHISLPEKAVHTLRMKPLPLRKLNDALLHAFTYWAYRPALPFPGVLRYFQGRWGLNHVWQVPIVGIRKALKRH